MKDTRPRYRHWRPFQRPSATTWLQAPLPDFLHTLPILLSIEGQGSGRQGPSPLAPPEEPAHDK